MVAAGFLSRYLNGPLLYVRRHITVNKNVSRASFNVYSFTSGHTVNKLQLDGATKTVDLFVVYSDMHFELFAWSALYPLVEYTLKHITHICKHLPRVWHRTAGINKH